MTENQTPPGGYFLEELSPGRSAELLVDLTEERILRVAEAGGDL